MEIIEQWKPIGLEALDHRLIENETRLGKHVAETRGAPAARPLRTPRG